MDAQIKQFLEDNAPHFEVAVEGKSIRCKLTNHEMPMRLDTLNKYIEGKKYKHMRDWYAQDFKKYEPQIVSHRTNPKLLYCNVTKMELNKIPEEIEAHINGRRYKKLLDTFMARYNKYNKPLEEGEEQFIVESSEEEADEDQDQQSDEEMSDADGEFEDEGSDFEVVPTNDAFEAMGPSKKAEDDDFDFSVVTNGNGDAMEEDDEEQGPAAKKQKLSQQSSKATSNGSSNTNGRKRKKPKQN